MRVDELPLAANSQLVKEQCLKRWWRLAVPDILRKAEQPPEDFDWVAQHLPAIHAAIEAIEAPATRRIHYSSLMSLLRATGAATASTEPLFQRAISESENDGLNKMKVTFLPLGSLKVRLGELRAALPNQAQTKEEKEAVLMHAALACYTLQPPLRRDWGDVEVVAKPGIPSAGRGKLLTHKDPWEIEILHDKVVRTKGSDTLGITPELKEALTRSLSIFPRRWVLCKPTDPDKCLGTGQPLSGLLAKVHHKRRTGVNCYRKAWASTLAGRPEKEWQQLARMMRTSVEKLRTVYLALDCPKAEDETVGKSEEGHDIVKRVDPEEWAAGHLQEQEDKNRRDFEAFRKRANRAVLLRDLRLHQRRPKKATLDKYGVEWNGTDWV